MYITYNTLYTKLYNSLSLSLPQVFVKEHFIHQTPISRADAIVGHNANLLVSHLRIYELRARTDRRVERLEQHMVSTSLLSLTERSKHTTIHLLLPLATSSSTPIKFLANPRFLNLGETSSLPTSHLCRPVSVSGIYRLPTPATSSSSSPVSCTTMTRVPASTCELHSPHEARILSWESGGRKVASVWSVVMQVACRRAMEGRRYWWVMGS